MSNQLGMGNCDQVLGVEDTSFQEPDGTIASKRDWRGLVVCGTIVTSALSVSAGGTLTITAGRRVELMLGLDWEHLLRPGEDLLVMRRALRGILPEAVRTRAGTAAHLAPVYAGLRANWPRISHLVTGERLAELGVVEPKLFREAVNVMRAGHPGPGRNAAVSMTALYLETWMNLKAGRCSPAERLSATGP